MAENFATKYRSKGVEQYIGNEVAVQKLLNRLSPVKEMPYPSTIMVSGASGCGKTTIARMATKLVLCENKQVKKWHNREYRLPCNECAMCLQLDKYIETADFNHLYNVKELDSSKTGNVDAVRSFTEEASTPSMFRGYSIFIIDECHLISNSGQEAMLKFTEDAPPRSIFIFCTTDPEKVIATLRNRMDLKISIETPTVEDNVRLMTWVAEQEGFAFQKTALELIAERSKHVYRTSLKTLEDVYRSYGSVRYEDVEKGLDTSNTALYFEFYRYLRSKNTVLYTQLVYKAITGVGIKRFVEELREFTKRGLYINTGLSVYGVTKTEMRHYKDLFKEFSVEEVYQVLSFLDNIHRGDVETKLLLWGYQGLSPITEVVKHEKVEKPTIALSPTDVQTEEGLVKKQRQADKALHHEETVSKAELTMKPVGAEGLAELFAGL